jgi:formiminotetrahydrofolate cyclodeaminase
MVAGMSRGKKNYLQYERELSDTIARLATLREEFKAAIDADAASYDAVMKAYKQAKAKTAAEGDGIIAEALKGATNVPLGVAERAREVVHLVEMIKPITNPRMASDLAVAAALAQAALTGALANVEINLADLNDKAFVDQVRSRTSALNTV